MDAGVNALSFSEAKIRPLDCGAAKHGITPPASRNRIGSAGHWQRSNYFLKGVPVEWHIFAVKG
jgi:hypothetical protein